MCCFSKNDEVADLGTGTGTIAYSICSKVNKVIGIDNSPDMLKGAVESDGIKNIQFVCADIRKMPFLDASFDKVTARMVFHHVLKGLDTAFEEVRRILKPKGIFCFSEGIPPDKCVDRFYREIFKLKEKRRTFYPENIKNMFQKHGFKKIKTRIFTMKQCSVRNWLNNAGNLSEETKNKIYQMHLDLHDKGKKAYKMKISGKDCFIDMKFVIVTGIK